jgi:regulatory protein
VPVISSPAAAHETALGYLARRTHFASDIERKLLTKGFAPEHVSGAIERLRRSALLDDRRSAAEWVAARLRRAPQGRRRLRADLERRGISREIVDAVLDEALSRDEGDLVREAARRFRRRRRSADARALGRHLSRLGFSTRDILMVSEESQDLQPSDDDPGC